MKCMFLLTALVALASSASARTQYLRCASSTGRFIMDVTLEYPSSNANSEATAAASSFEDLPLSMADDAALNTPKPAGVVVLTGSEGTHDDYRTVTLIIQPGDANSAAGLSASLLATHFVERNSGLPDRRYDDVTCGNTTGPNQSPRD